MALLSLKTEGGPGSWGRPGAGACPDTSGGAQRLHPRQHPAWGPSVGAGAAARECEGARRAIASSDRQDTTLGQSGEP